MTDLSDNPSLFEAPSGKLFFTRDDIEDRRLGDIARSIHSFSSVAEGISRLMQKLRSPPDGENALNEHFCIAGYPDDEGIRINGGRLGAATAPDEIRRSLYKMTPRLEHHRSHASQLQLHDVGNLQTHGGEQSERFELKDRHHCVALLAAEALAGGARWIGLGGGHDYGFADGSGFCEWLKKSQPTVRPLIINFDAHLDVRPCDSENSSTLSSGTPFYRLLEKYPEIELAEIGIQSQCNSQHHLEWVKERGGRVLMQETLENSSLSLLEHVKQTLKPWLNSKPVNSKLTTRPTFLSIDIDAFTSSVAPGCSQSWATGLTPREFFPVLTFLLQELDVRMLSVYEVSPPLDHDLRTAKLAAQIIHRFLYP